VQARLDRRCDDNACQAVSLGWTWTGCGAGTLRVELDIRDSRGVSASVNGQQAGCVSASGVSGLDLPAQTGGNLSVRVGLVNGTTGALLFGCSAPLGCAVNWTANLTAPMGVSAQLPISAWVGEAPANAVTLAQG
jgi:hypothetical protein